MHRIKLILKKGNLSKDGTAPIYIEYMLGRGQRTWIKTGKRVNPEDWNNAKGEVKRSHSDSGSINQFVKGVKRQIETIADDAVLRGEIPTIDLVKSRLAKDSGKSTQLNLNELLDEWISYREDAVTKDVIKDYKALRKHLNGYSDTRNRKLSVLDLNERFYEDFVKYLGNDVIHSQGKRGLMKSSIGKQIKNLKSFLRYCMRQEYIPKDDLVGFKKPTDSSDAVYVNYKELDLLTDLDFADNPKLDIVRDLFIIGCETGLRFSDFSKLNIDHISDGLIRKPVRKTGKKVVIPISKRLQRVLDKNGMKIPDCPNSLYFNERIKEVCKLAGIDSQFSRIIQRGNRKEEVSVPKYEAIASHTCRRSFCTNQFLKGMPALLIRKISGHATEKAFLQYIKIDEEKAAEEMAKRWIALDNRG